MYARPIIPRPVQADSQLLIVIDRLIARLINDTLPFILLYIVPCFNHFYEYDA